MAFQKGVSGNPSGRPKGTTDKRTSLRAMLEPHAAELINKLLEQARDGNMQAMKLLIERLIPPMRESRMEIQLPELTDAAACSLAQAEIVNAVANGHLMCSEANAISGLVEYRRKALETYEFAERLAALEQKL